MIRRIGVKDGSLLILKLQMGVKRMMLKRIILEELDTMLVGLFW